MVWFVLVFSFIFHFFFPEPAEYGAVEIPLETLSRSWPLFFRDSAWLWRWLSGDNPGFSLPGRGHGRGGGGESSWIVRHGNQINPVGYVQIVGISCNRCGTYRLDR